MGSTPNGGVRKGYVDGPYGQLHLRASAAVPGQMPLVCLHATAYSSQTFLPLMAAYEGKRQVIAIDAPGYGASDAPTGPVEIEGYAAAIGTAIESSAEGPVELLGYHTGAYIAAQLAIDRPDLVARLVLIGIPYFEAIGREQWRARLSARHELTAELGQFEERWDHLVTRPHVAGLSLSRAFANFVDELHAWPDGWWAHEAMFAWDSAVKLPRVTQPVRVINPAGHLAVASRAAAALMPSATVIEMPDVEGPIFDLASHRIVQAMEAEGV